LNIAMVLISLPYSYTQYYPTWIPYWMRSQQVGAAWEAMD